MLCAQSSDTHGYTFLELIISLSVGLIFMGALISTFTVQQQTFEAQVNKAEAVQTVRAAMNIISQEVMMAGFNPDPAGNLQQDDDSLSDFVGIVFDKTATELEIRSDLNRNGKIVKEAVGTDPNRWKYDENERIVYKKINNQLKRKTGGGYFQPFAENVREFTFRYLKADESPAANASEIRFVEIVIEVQTSKTEKASGYGRKRLVSRVALRNL